MKPDQVVERVAALADELTRAGVSEIDLARVLVSEGASHLMIAVGRDMAVEILAGHAARLVADAE